MAQMSPEAVDAQVMRIITTAIGELGGPSQMVSHHDHDILPALVESAYALVLREEAGESTAAIADFLGVSAGAVESVLAAPTEAHRARLHYHEDELPEFERHSDPDWAGKPDSERLEPEYFAGAVAKFAYAVVKRQETRAH